VSERIPKKRERFSSHASIYLWILKQTHSVEQRVNQSNLERNARMQKKFACLAITLLSFLSGITQAASAGTAFTYQGLLSMGGNPANGFFDFRCGVTHMDRAVRCT